MGCNIIQGSGEYDMQYVLHMYCISYPGSKIAQTLPQAHDKVRHRRHHCVDKSISDPRLVQGKTCLHLVDIRRELGPLWCETNLANTELSLHKAFRGRAGKVRSCQLGECRVLMFVDLPPLEHVNMLVQKQSPALRLGVTVISEPQGGFPSVTL